MPRKKTVKKIVKKAESELVEILKNIALLGAGTVAVTKKKANEIISSLKKQGITEEEGEKLVKDIITKNKEQMKLIENKMQKMIDKTITKLKPVTKKELKTLENRIKKLEKKIK